MKGLFTLTIALLLTFTAISQERTVGILQAEDEAYLRYQLFISVDQPYAAMIDMCGGVINEWELDEVGLTIILMDEGKILVSGQIKDGNFAQPGKTGLLQIWSWDNDLLWEAKFTEGRYGAHHEFAVTPSGTILLTVWEKFTGEEAIAAGRDTSITIDEFWPEAILELQPIGTDSFNIVWEWHMWDHLIQDRDSTLANFGAIDEHPERFDLNFATKWQDNWVHANGLEYNAKRDEILVSCRSWNEIFVIDHSTTSAEAATSEGGKSGRGGDILYRWGNPVTYGRGNSSDQRLGSQHDASFDLTRSSEDTLLLTAYSNNNGFDKPTEVVDIKVALTDEDGYVQPIDFQAFGPDSVAFTFDGNPPGAFNSPFMGSYDVLPNGNMLITSAILGEYFEYTRAGELVWHYKVPVGLFGIMAQGDTINGRVFKAYSYELDDPRLMGKDLTPIKRAIELEPLRFDCPYDILSDVDDFQVSATVFTKVAYLNASTLSLIFENARERRIQVHAMSGHEVINYETSSNESILDMKSLSSGVYALRVVHLDEQISEVIKIVKAE